MAPSSAAAESEGVREAVNELLASAGGARGAHAMDPERKLAAVTRLFDAISGHYDALNYVVSLGATEVVRWMALVVPLACAGAGSGGGRLLDVGCGTGNVVHLVQNSARLRGAFGEVVSIDPSEGMVAQARRRCPQREGFTFARGDVGGLAYPDGSFDAVTTVYTLRNFGSLDGALREMVRVARPGGLIVILDAFPPPWALMRWALGVWLDRVMVPLASLFVEDASPYAWLAKSIQSTVPAEAVGDALGACDGVEGVRVSHLLGGAFASIVASKRGKKKGD